MPSNASRFHRTEISSRDRRQYGAVAYALRAILAVQQDALVDGTKLVPLDEPDPNCLSTLNLRQTS